MANLRVATWNIAGGRREATSVADLAAVLAGIRALDPDLLAIQEVDRQLARSDRADQPQQIAQALGPDCSWSYAPALTGDDFRALSGPDPGGPAYGTLLLSRLPLEQTEQLRFPQPAAASNAPRWSAPSGSGRARSPWRPPTRPTSRGTTFASCGSCRGAGDQAGAAAAAW